MAYQEHSYSYFIFYAYNSYVLHSISRSNQVNKKSVSFLSNIIVFLHLSRWNCEYFHLRLRTDFRKTRKRWRGKLFLQRKRRVIVYWLQFSFQFQCTQLYTHIEPNVNPIQCFSFFLLSVILKPWKHSCEHWIRILRGRRTFSIRKRGERERDMEKGK